jgi:hypothetical protein
MGHDCIGNKKGSYLKYLKYGTFTICIILSRFGVTVDGVALVIGFVGRFNT